MTNFADSVRDALQNVHFKPTRTRVELNDKATKKYFNLDAETYDFLINKHGTYNIVEKKNHKKHGKVRTPTTLSNADGYSNVKPLNEFDRAVQCAIISEQLAGNRYTTPAIIFRALVGKVGEVGVTPSVNQEKAILESIDKLMFTRFNADTAKSFEILKYPNGDEIKLKKSAILPACIVDAKINGQVIDNVIFFDRESPLYLIANAKNQIIRYDAKLLDVPNMNNTPMIITIKNYVIRRICEIKLHKQLAKTLTFDDIFQKCRIDKASNKTKFDARNIIFRFLQHLIDHNFIDSFDIVKNKNGKKFYAVTFTFSEKIPENNFPDTPNSDGKPSYSNLVISSSNSVTNYSNSGTSYSNSGIRHKSKHKKKGRRRADSAA